MKASLMRLWYRGIGELKRKTLKDEYLSWLCFANAGMLDAGNIYAMDIAIRNLPLTARLWRSAASADCPQMSCRICSGNTERPMRG